MYVRFAPGSDPPLALADRPSLRIRNQSLPSPTPSAAPAASQETSLPATTILSLGLGFIAAALFAIAVSLTLRFYFVTRVYPARTGHTHPSRRGPGEHARFRDRVADWWSTFWAGPGEFWETTYVVRRKQRRPEMWEVLVAEKELLYGEQQGEGGRASHDGPADVGQEKAVVAAPNCAQAEASSPGVKLVRIAEEEDALSDAWQVSLLHACRLR